MTGAMTETVKLHLNYDVVLLNAGDNLISMITALQTVSEVDVATADRYLSVLPRTVLQCAPWKDARAAKRALEEVGARVELRLCE
jgi:ribosomal protein L7/L12